MLRINCTCGTWWKHIKNICFCYMFACRPAENMVANSIKIWLEVEWLLRMVFEGLLDLFSTIFGVPNPSMLHLLLHVIFMLIFKESLENQKSWGTPQGVVKCTLGGGATTSYQTTSFTTKYLEFSQTCCCTLHRLRRLDKLQAHRLRKLHNLQIYMTCN